MMFRKRGEGPPPRPPVSKNLADGLAAEHVYVSDFQDDELPSCHSELYQLLRDKRADACFIQTPHWLHHEHALKCLEAGCHVFIEKPLAITVATGRKIVEAARAKKLTLGVAEVVRFMLPTRAVQWVIQHGVIGEVKMFAWGVWGGHEWAPDIIPARTPWRLKKLKSGGGPSVDLGVHWFDMIRYQCGEVKTVSALVSRMEDQRFLRDDAGRVIESSHVDVEDTFLANFTLANGGIGHLSFSWSGRGAGSAIEGGPVIWGSKGCIKGGRIIFDDGMKADVVTYFQQHAPPTLKEKWFPQGITDPFALQFLDFLRAVEHGHEPEVSGEEGLRDLAAAYSILESAAAEKMVEVADVLQGKAAKYQKDVDRHFRSDGKKA